MPMLTRLSTLGEVPVSTRHDTGTKSESDTTSYRRTRLLSKSKEEKKKKNLIDGSRSTLIDSDEAAIVLPLIGTRDAGWGRTANGEEEKGWVQILQNIMGLH